MTASIDPRAHGFNYGAPIAEPHDWLYHFQKQVAEIARKRNSHRAIERSWALDQILRDVRVSCSIAEQHVHLKRLSAFVTSSEYPRVTEKQARGCIQRAYDTWLSCLPATKLKAA